MKWLFRKRKEREIHTVETMIRMYCRAKHHTKGTLCESCAEVFSYATMKYNRCVFGEQKPVCTVCPVHCYNKDMRERIRVIMRFAGPRMILHHPVMAIDHLILQRWSRKNMPVFLKRVKKKKGTGMRQKIA